MQMPMPITFTKVSASAISRWMPSTRATLATGMEPAEESVAASTTKAAPEQNVIELHPLGRVENCYRWAGETDVFEAIEAVCRNYKIDRDRIVLRGMTMEAGTSRFPNWAGWQLVLSCLALGSLRASTHPGMGPSALASPWRAIWDSA